MSNRPSQHAQQNSYLFPAFRPGHVLALIGYHPGCGLFAVLFFRPEILPGARLLWLAGRVAHDGALPYQIHARASCRYKYGHATEVSVDANGNAVPKKWFPLGRLGWEMPYAMPDRRTVYNADDAFMVSECTSRHECIGGRARRVPAYSTWLPCC